MPPQPDAPRHPIANNSISDSTASRGSEGKSRGKPRSPTWLSQPKTSRRTVLANALNAGRGCCRSVRATNSPLRDGAKLKQSFMIHTMNPPTNLHAAPGAATTLRKKHFKQRGSVLTELGFLGFFVLTLGVSFHLVSSLGFFGLDSRGTISPDELITANRDGPASFETAEQAHRLDKAEQSPAVADATQLAGLWQA